MHFQTMCIQADHLHCLTTIGPPTDSSVMFLMLEVKLHDICGCGPGHSSITTVEEALRCNYGDQSLVKATLLLLQWYC